MEQILKELIPVIKEAIIAGKVIGIWYIVAITIIPVLKTLLNWTFILIISKGFYSLIEKGMKNNGKSF